MIRLLLLVIFVTKSNTLPTNQTEACNNYQQNNKFLWTEILEFNETTYKIYYFLKFKKFTDLLLECNKTYNTFNLNEVKFVPAQRMLLNNDEFRLEKLFKIDTTKKSYFENKFIFRKFDGLILTNFASNKKPVKNDVSLTFEYFRLDFYWKNKTKLKISKCNKETLKNFTSFIDEYSDLDFSVTVYPKEGLCPFVFGHSRAKTITFNKIINSLIVQNRLSFIETNVSVSPIENLQFLSADFHYESLTSSLLNKEIFRNILYLKLSNILNRVEIGLLRKFHLMREVHFQLVNLREFFHAENTKWMLDLNTRIPQGVVNFHDPKTIENNIHNFMFLLLELLNYNYAFSKTYDYPLEDICLFKDFPHTNLVLPVLHPYKFLNCTCTIKWLQNYYIIFGQYISLNFISATPNME